MAEFMDYQFIFSIKRKKNNLRPKTHLVRVIERINITFCLNCLK